MIRNRAWASSLATATTPTSLITSRSVSRSRAIALAIVASRGSGGRAWSACRAYVGPLPVVDREVAERLDELALAFPAASSDAEAVRAGDPCQRTQRLILGSWDCGGLLVTAVGVPWQTGPEVRRRALIVAQSHPDPLAEVARAAVGRIATPAVGRQGPPGPRPVNWTATRMSRRSKTSRSYTVPQRPDRAPRLHAERTTPPGGCRALGLSTRLDDALLP